MRRRKLAGLLRSSRFGSVYAGRFLEVAKLAQPVDVTIRLAQEFWNQERATIAIETHDFQCPPNHQQVKYAMLVAAQALAEGYDVYCGCAGGIGRTGMFLAVLVAAYRPRVEDPIAFVRVKYNTHSVATASQEAWVHDFVRRNQSFFTQLRAVLRSAGVKRTRTRKRRQSRPSQTTLSQDGVSLMSARGT
jgi:protein-tyrosine phosphatase